MESRHSILDLEPGIVWLNFPDLSFGERGHGVMSHDLVPRGPCR
jgi:hypothetical protein